MESHPPLPSLYAADPDMRDLLVAYRGMLAETCAQLAQAVCAGDVQTVWTVGHQLKGSGAGYGYPALSEAGERLERAAGLVGRIDDTVKAHVEELCALCRRAVAADGCRPAGGNP